MTPRAAPAGSTGARPTILVFDSGVGGLSLFREIGSVMPAAKLVFACDNALFPYGTKPEDELLRRVEAVVGAFARRIRPDLIVVACNTASTIALPRLREMLAIPIVGVVPAIKPAAAASGTRVIGLLATPATVRRRYTQELIDRFAVDCLVIRLGSAALVVVAEQKMRGGAPDPGALRALLAPLFEAPEGAASPAGSSARTRRATAGPESIQASKRGAAAASSSRSSGKCVQASTTVSRRSPGGAISTAGGHEAIFTRAAPDVAGLASALAHHGCHSVSVL